MASDEDRTSGRAVLVTGAARGIGRAIAEAFAGQGERVAVHYGHSAALAGEVLAGLPGSGHAAVQADLADPQAVRAMVGQAIEALGGLDVLVNNAGVFIRTRSPAPRMRSGRRPGRRRWPSTSPGPRT